MIQSKSTLFPLVVVSIFMAIMSGCAGTHVSKFSYDETYTINEPIKGEKCYDASVLLGVDIKRAKDIAKKVIIALDSKMTEEQDTSIKAQRNAYIGVLVGSGGEELSVNLNVINSNKTFITATTKTGLVGAAGQKAWSCRIIDEMLKMAAK